MADRTGRRGIADLLTPTVLAESPELAILEMLDDCAHLTLRALVAVHPDLVDDQPPQWLPEPTTLAIVAADVIARIALLQDSIAQYRHQVALYTTTEPPYRL